MKIGKNIDIDINFTPNPILVIVFVILFILLGSWLIFWMGYVIGIITQFVIGDKLITGINLLFKTNYSKYELPLIAGTVTWLGSLLTLTLPSKTKT